MKRLIAFAFAFLFPILGSAHNSYIDYPSGTAPSFEGVWWNAAESGWGVSVTHQGDVLFAVWYTYDRDGAPIWLVMPNAALVNTSDNDMDGMMEMSMMSAGRTPPMFTGAIYRATGPAFSSATFDRNAVGVREVGMGTLLFKEDNNAVFAYTVDDFSGAKNITRMAFSSSMPSCSVGGEAKASGPRNYQDMWWRPSESGWGVNIAHQGDTLFATWFTYDAAGRGQWLVMSNAARTGDGRYAGKVYRTTGPAFDSSTWDASRVRTTEVGTASFTFGDASNGTFAYTVEGVTRSKPIERMVYALPASICN